MNDPQGDVQGPAEIVYLYCQSIEDVDEVRAQLAIMPVSIYAVSARLSFDALAPSLIVTGANVLVAVIGGLLSYINAKNGRTIHIKGSNGFEVTVPVGTSHEELDRLVRLATQSQPNHVILASDAPTRQPNSK